MQCQKKRNCHSIYVWMASMDQRECFFYVSNLILAPLSIFGLYKRISTTLQTLICFLILFLPPSFVCSSSLCCNHITFSHSPTLCLSAGLRGSCTDRKVEKDSQLLLQPHRTSLRQSCRPSSFYSSPQFFSCLF